MRPHLRGRLACGGISWHGLVRVGTVGGVAEEDVVEHEHVVVRRLGRVRRRDMSLQKNKTKQKQTKWSHRYMKETKDHTGTTRNKKQKTNTRITTMQKQKYDDTDNDMKQRTKK